VTIRLKGIDLLLTYECTGRCTHCCYRAGPQCSGTMTIEEVKGYLAAVADQPLEWILLSGGEPFLCYDLLRASVALAAPLARVLVFTNGCWATDPDTARQRLAGLQEAGLDHIQFSVDGFHQAHVPLERVAVGIEAARELGFGAVEIDNCCLAQAGADSFFIRRTRDVMARLAELCDLSGVGVGQSTVRMVGRAADQLSPFLRTQPTLPTQCPLPGYLGGDLRAPTGVEIHPGGWVNLCAGLSVGNARARPLNEILAGYDPDAHPLIRALAQEGPQGLLRLAKRHGFSAAGGYVDGCHLCYQARRFLRPHYPDHLAPTQVYEEVFVTVLELQKGILYGPIDSRRLGRSLGINLLPSDTKLCSFDCAYCQYGRTGVKTLSPERKDLPSLEQVLDAVEKGLQAHANIDTLTFSGNGEPTLHPDFPAIVSGVRRLRDELRPDVKLAILSNSTAAHLPHVRDALELFDAPIMKLDAGDARTLDAINRPAAGVKLEHIVEGLKGIPGLVIQSVLVDGRVSNARGKAFDTWLAALSEIRPAQVQIYSTDRPVPDAGVEQVDPATLQRIAAEIEQRTGVPAKAYWA
jgi:wyosine [tRNA(Phe)-imidazoG37] synthetase (radical SAM superfamily)